MNLTKAARVLHRRLGYLVAKLDASAHGPKSGSYLSEEAAAIRRVLEEIGHVDEDLLAEKRARCAELVVPREQEEHARRRSLREQVVEVVGELRRVTGT